MRRVIGWFTTLLAAVVAFLGIVTIILLPGLHRRRTMARWTGWAIMTAGGCPVRVIGLDRIPDGHCVLVANHASYIDGAVMQGVLPSHFAFVVKQEAAEVPLISTMLRRIGAAFVDRSGVQSRSNAGKQILARADDGEALAFFPEGTFRGIPGLGKFRSGAFLTAIRAGVPVVPAIIRGTRDAMPEGYPFLIPHRVEVEFLEPHQPPEQGPGQARRFMAEVRQAMLAAMDEPDLEEEGRAPHAARGPAGSP
jgi:1-acyl-sn-glycerol-3-phosphate acyltransferase